MRGARTSSSWTTTRARPAGKTLAPPNPGRPRPTTTTPTTTHRCAIRSVNVNATTRRRAILVTTLTVATHMIVRRRRATLVTFPRATPTTDRPGFGVGLATTVLRERERDLSLTHSLSLSHTPRGESRSGGAPFASRLHHISRRSTSDRQSDSGLMNRQWLSSLLSSIPRPASSFQGLGRMVGVCCVLA